MDDNINPSATLKIAIRTERESSSSNKYPAKAHCRRVARKVGRNKNVLAILQGEKAAYFSSSDQYRPFRQDRYFYYMTGCNEPGCFATYSLDDDKLILWLPPIDLTRVFYEGKANSTVEEAMKRYDIDEAYYFEGSGIESNLAFMLRDHHSGGGECLFMRSATGIVHQSIRASWKGQGRPGLLLRQAIDACRAVKDSYEIELIRKANAVSAKAHIAILKQLHAIKSEPEVEAVYIATCIVQGARYQSYGPIIGSGPNASQLHYMDNNEKFGERQTLLIDAGAEWDCYASDVTRTMPINPSNPGVWQSDEAKAVYQHVEKIQDECIAQLRPGKHFIDVVFHSIHMAIDALLDLGILKGDHMDIFHNGVSAAFYPHGLGHHVGLEVHDAFPPVEKKGGKGRFKDVRKAYNRFAQSSPAFATTATFNRPRKYSINPSFYQLPSTPLDPPLVPGMIVTVEPGLYFNPFFLENYYLHNPEYNKFIDKTVLKRYMHVGGVRIEDDILITEDGYENITTAPKGEEMLKVIRDAAKVTCN